MIVQFALVIILVFMLAPVDISADGQSGSASRWGITTKKNLEDVRKTAPGETGSAHDTKAPSAPAQPPVESPDTSALDKTDTTMAPGGNAPAPAGNAMKAEPPKNRPPLPPEKQLPHR